MEYLKIKVYGNVQGVFFRHSAKKIAESLKLTGFAQNNLDGSVLVEAQGEKENLEKLLHWCKIGPPSAKVERVEFEFLDGLKGFNDFTIN